jgi:pilus assembly protein Flp/PilA
MYYDLLSTLERGTLKMLSIIRKLARDTEGSNALEYGLIVGLISLAIVAGAGAAGTALGTIFNTVGTQIATASTTITT